MVNSSQREGHPALKWLEQQRHPSWLEQGSLQGAEWKLKKADLEKVRRTKNCIVNFGVAVAPGVLLTDESFSHDLRTLKTVLYRELSVTGSIKSESSAVQRARFYIHFVRWRTKKKIFRNSDLTQEWLDVLLQELASAGPSGLVPSAAAVHRLCEDVLNGRASSPQIYRKGKAYLDTNEVLLRAGFSHVHHLDSESIAALHDLSRALGIEVYRDGLPAKFPTKVSAAAISNFLQGLPWLWRHRDFLVHDPIGFEPYAKTSVNAVVSKMVGVVPTSRTVTVPSAQVCALIDKALSWVLEYGPHLLELKHKFDLSISAEFAAGTDRPFRNAVVAALRDFSPLQRGATCPWPIRPVFQESTKSVDYTGRPTFQQAVLNMLPAACFIVIAAFGARRVREIESLRRESCKPVKDGFFLKAYASKGLRDLDPIPVPASVYRAVMLLEELVGLEQQFLFDFSECVPGRGERADANTNRTRFHPYAHMELFARHVNYGVLDQGPIWIPKPHQFRRIFAVVYFNRFRFPHLTALSVFFRHDSLQMTARYYTEPHRGVYVDDEHRRSHERDIAEFRREFEDEAHRFKVERLTSTLVDGEFIGGFGGQALQRRYEILKQDARARMELVSGDIPRASLITLVHMLAKEVRLEPHGEGHSYCKGTDRPEDKASSICMKKAVARGVDPALTSIPVHAEASPDACAGCPLNVQFAENESYWRKMQEEVESKMKAKGHSPILNEHMAERGRVIERHLAAWYENGAKRDDKD